VKEIKQSREQGLRERIIEAAGKLFVDKGYEGVSMRRVAEEAGCSQMAMYRHFANKEALTQHLCAQLYSGFTEKMHREIKTVDQPWERIRIFVLALLDFAVAYPDHYTLIFLQRHANPEVFTERERLGQEFLKGIRRIVRDILPADTPAAIVDMRLRQIVTCLHGTAGLLIAHPKAYGLSKQKAVKDMEDAVSCLLKANL